METTQSPATATESFEKLDSAAKKYFHSQEKITQVKKYAYVIVAPHSDGMDNQFVNAEKYLHWLLTPLQVERNPTGFEIEDEQIRLSRQSELDKRVGSYPNAQPQANTGEKCTVACAAPYQESLSAPGKEGMQHAHD